MKHKKQHPHRRRRTCYDRLRMRTREARRRGNPAASAWLQLMAIFMVICGRLPLPASASASPYIAPQLSPIQAHRNDVARRLGVPRRYIDVMLAYGRVPYPVLFEDIRKGGPMRKDALHELRKQIPDAAVDWFDHVEKEGMWSDLMRCFDQTGPDEHTNVRFLKATLAWVVGPHGIAPDPSPGDGVTRVIID